MQVWTLLCFTYLTIQPWAKGKQWPVTSLGYQGGAVDKGLSLSPKTHLVKAAVISHFHTPGNACIMHVMFLNKKVFERKNLFTLVLRATEQRWFELNHGCQSHKAFYRQVREVRNTESPAPLYHYAWKTLLPVLLFN